jgi:MFS family permease
MSDSAENSSNFQPSAAEIYTVNSTKNYSAQYNSKNYEIPRNSPQKFSEITKNLPASPCHTVPITSSSANTAIPPAFKPVLLFFFLQMISFGVLTICVPALLLYIADDSTSYASTLKSALDPIAPALQMLTNPYFGLFSDRKGRKMFLYVSIAQMLGLSVVLGIYPCLATIIIGSIIRGLDCSMMTSSSMLADTTDKVQFVTQHGKLGASLGLGIMLGPLLGAGISQLEQYRAPFLFCAVLSLINLFWVYKKVRETLGIKQNQLIGNESAHNSAGNQLTAPNMADNEFQSISAQQFEPDNCANVVGKINDKSDKTSQINGDSDESEATNYSNPSEFHSFDVDDSAVAGVAELPVLTSYNPLKTMKILAYNRVVLLLSVVYLLQQMIILGMAAVFYLHNHTKFHWNQAENAGFLFVTAVMSITAQGLLLPLLYKKASFVARRLGEKGLIGTGLFMQLVYLFLFAFVPSSAPWAMFLVLLLAWPSFTNNCIIRGAIARFIPNAQQGELNGALGALGAFSAILGPILFGQTLAYFTADGNSYFPGAVFLVALGVSVLSSFLLLLGQKIYGNLGFYSSTEILQNIVRPNENESGSRRNSVSSTELSSSGQQQASQHERDTDRKKGQDNQRNLNENYDDDYGMQVTDLED